MTAPASAREVLRLPPTPDGARAQVRGAVGAGQLVYGVLRLRRTGQGWYHVILGARQVVQARLDTDGRLSPGADAAIDGIHVASLLGLAVVRRTRRREALLGAAHGLAWALVDTVLRRRPPDPPGGAAQPGVRRTRA
ncbi:MAG TPA: hypothetical protein VE781_03205 [Kineosporiaceae bacterium]|jgi:hypothetical protein|nr:hypothetical protein [Kineosporiaceae bacterium]